jgi:hypothetical protein
MAHTQMPKQEFKECKPNQEAMNRVREDMYKQGMFCKEFQIVQGYGNSRFVGEPSAIMLFEEPIVEKVKTETKIQ